MATIDSDDSQQATAEMPRIGLRKVVEAEIAPTDFAVAPGDTDRKFIVDQPGAVHVLRDGSLREEPFLDIRDQVVELYHGHDERGLLGLEFHPEYARNRTFYVRYSSPPREGTPDDWDHTEVLSEFEATEDGARADPDSERVVMEIPHPGSHHNAGQLAFGPEGYLYFGMGDGGDTGDTGKGHVEGGNGQNITENLMGSILRIDVDAEPTEHPRIDDNAPEESGSDEGYAIPETNPLVGEEGLDEYYAWGLRNPWRLSFDGEGRLFVADVGEHLFEWVNLVEKGGNYGWNITEGSHCFDPEAQWEPADDCPDVNDRGEELLDPIVEYPHVEDAAKVGELLGSAIIGGHVYEGDALPSLQGTYVFGDLSKRYDAPRGRLFAATPPDGDETDEWDFEPLRIEGLDSNLVDGYLFTLGQDNDGELYVLASQTLNTKEEPGGVVYEVVPPEESEVSGPEYGWYDAASDAYWYSLYNMNNTFVQSGNGIVFPFDEEQFESLKQEVAAAMKGLMQKGMVMMRKKRILNHAPRVEKLPVENPNLNIASFTTGDPHFLEDPQVPVRHRNRQQYQPDADTMRWDREQSSQVISPASFGWTHLKGITWAKSFEHEFHLAPIASRDRPQVLGTAAQLGIKFALQNEHLLADDGGDGLRLVGVYRPATDEVVEEEAGPEDYAAMLWFLSDMVSFAENGWYGYENPRPMLDVEEIQELADRMATTTFEEYPPQAVLDAGTTRDLGVMLSAAGWYGTHAGDAELVSATAEYANGLADLVESNVMEDGLVENGGPHQAATQGAVGQGLLWASEVDGVDRRDVATPILEYLLEDLWDEQAGTFASGRDATTYTVTPRHAGDITGGLNAANVVLGLDGVKERFATHFDQTFNRGRLQRATRWQSYRPERDLHLPLSQNAGEQSSPSPASQAQQDAGGEYGQAAVYNAEVEYDVDADEWRVTDDAFHTEGALYLSNQDLWASVWGGSTFPGRGVPGQTDRLERWEAERQRGYTPPATE